MSMPVILGLSQNCRQIHFLESSRPVLGDEHLNNVAFFEIEGGRFQNVESVSVRTIRHTTRVITVLGRWNDYADDTRGR